MMGSCCFSPEMPDTDPESVMGLPGLHTLSPGRQQEGNPCIPVWSWRVAGS